MGHTGVCKPSFPYVKPFCDTVHLADTYTQCSSFEQVVHRQRFSLTPSTDLVHRQRISSLFADLVNVFIDLNIAFTNLVNTMNTMSLRSP